MKTKKFRKILLNTAFAVLVSAVLILSGCRGEAGTAADSSAAQSADPSAGSPSGEAQEKHTATPEEIAAMAAPGSDPAEAAADDGTSVSSGSDEPGDPTPTPYANLVKPKEINFCLTDLADNPDTLVLIASGDANIDDNLLSALTKDGAADLSPLFADIKEKVSSADIALLAQCSDLTPEGAAAVADTGFDYPFLTESSPSGQEGLITETASDGISFITCKEMTVAIVSEAEASGNLEDSLKTANEKADVVIALTASGSAEEANVSEERRNAAMSAAEAGADIIIDGNAHKLLDVTAIRRESDDVAVPVLYCPGDLVSSETGPEGFTGGLVEFMIQRDPYTGNVTPIAMEFIPAATVTDENGLPKVTLLTDIKPAAKQTSEDTPSTVSETAELIGSYVHARYLNQSSSIFVYE